MEPSAAKPEVRLHGIGVSPGIVRAVAVVLGRPERPEAAVRAIRPEEVAGEISRFEQALFATREQIHELQQRIAAAGRPQEAAIFDAHLLVCEDQALIGEVIRQVSEERRNVEAVFQQVTRRYVDTLSGINDPYLRERVVDIEDVTDRILRNLLGQSAGPHPESVAHPHVVVAHNLTPADTVLMNRQPVLGFATDIGSKTSHTAIMANSLNIPAVVALHDATAQVATGDPLLLDGYGGVLIINPSEQTLYEYGEIETRKGLIRKELSGLRLTRSTTRDGRHIALSANIELPEEVEGVKESGAEGIGLYRTEFFFLNRPEPPTEEEQYRNYLQVAESVKPYDVIIRTLDLGGDKLAGVGEELEEANPFLGWRAIRVSLEQPDLFKQQLRAILRASAVGNVRMMYPMISGVEEFRRANQLLEECREELRAAGVPFKADMEVGAMIEVPSAAMVADLLAREADFFSIGTNDLIQYTIAVDRLNERIASLYQPTHPGIVRLIKRVADAAHAAGKWTGVCGEMAGEVVFTPLLLGLGMDELSAGAALVPQVKRAVQSLSTHTCRELAEECLALECSDKILARCREVARAHYPELID